MLHRPQVEVWVENAVVAEQLDPVFRDRSGVGLVPGLGVPPFRPLPRRGVCLRPRPLGLVGQDDLVVDVLDDLPDLEEVVGDEPLALEGLVAEVLVGQDVEGDLDELGQLLLDDDVDDPVGDGLVEEDALGVAAGVSGEEAVERAAAHLAEDDGRVAGDGEVLVPALRLVTVVLEKMEDSS